MLARLAAPAARVMARPTLRAATPSTPLFMAHQTRQMVTPLPGPMYGGAWGITAGRWIMIGVFYWFAGCSLWAAVYRPYIMERKATFVNSNPALFEDRLAKSKDDFWDLPGVRRDSREWE